MVSHNTKCHDVIHRVAACIHALWSCDIKRTQQQENYMSSLIKIMFDLEI